MVDMRISELATGTTLDGSEELVMVQSAGNAKLTTRDIAGAGAYSLRAKASVSAAQSLTGLTGNIVAFDNEDFNIGGFYSGGANTRMTVPAGVTLVNIQGFIQFTGASLATFTGSFGQIVHRNSADGLISNLRLFNVPSTIGRWNTEPIPVNAGDYFEIDVQPQTAGAFPLVLDGRCFFSINALAFDPLPAPPPPVPTRTGVVTGTYANGNSGVGNQTIALPATPAVGDIILVYGVSAATLGTNLVVTSGYTNLLNNWGNNSAASGVSYKISDGTEVDVVLGTQPLNPVAYMVEVWTGVDAADPFDGTTAVESTSDNISSITSTTDSTVSIVVGFSEGANSAAGITALAGYSGLTAEDTSGVGGAGSPATLAANSFEVTPAGVNDPGVWSWLTGEATRRSGQFLLKPVP